MEKAITMYGYELQIRGNTEYYSKRLYDLNGNHVGTISMSRPRKTSNSSKKKRPAMYSFKQVSAQVLSAKTSAKAAQVSIGIRMKIGNLQKKLKTGEYDDEEILRAILHAEMVQRACEKKKKNLKMEETAEQNMDEELPSEQENPLEKVQSDEEIRELEQEEFEALMEKLEMSAEEIYEEAEETAQLDQELDEMAEALSGAMEPQDLEQLKAKHRSDEARDIMKADLKYLKAMFERLQAEKENLGKSSVSSGFDSGVSLSLGGDEMPVMVQDSGMTEVGGMVDAEI